METILAEQGSVAVRMFLADFISLRSTIKQKDILIQHFKCKLDKQYKAMTMMQNSLDKTAQTEKNLQVQMRQNNKKNKQMCYNLKKKQNFFQVKEKKNNKIPYCEEDDITLANKNTSIDKKICFNKNEFEEDWPSETGDNDDDMEMSQVNDGPKYGEHDKTDLP